MARIGRTAARLLVGLCLVGVGLAFMSGGADAAKPTAAPVCVDPSAVTNIWYTNAGGVVLAIDTNGAIEGVQPGDTLTVHFLVQSTTKCPGGVELSLVSYSSPEPNFSPDQTVFAADTSTFKPGGPYTLTVMVPQTSATENDPDCNPQTDNSNGAPNGGGANQSPGPYDPSGCGLRSRNGVSEDNNSSKPCAGCVGNADAKNPPGQYPNGGDPNAGYECDRNQGVGQTNPAHTGCSGSPHWQLDFVSGKPITDFSQPPPDGTSYYGEESLINYANG